MSPTPPCPSNELERLQAACARMPGPPDEDGLRRAADGVLAFAVEDFARMAERTVGRSATPAQMQAALGEPLPEDGIGLERTLEEFRVKVAPFALRPAHPRFLAFVPGAPSFASVLGD